MLYGVFINLPNMAPMFGARMGSGARDLGGMPLRMRKKIRIRMAPSMAIPVLNG